MIKYHIEKYENCIKDLMPIITAHYSEVTTFKDVKKLDLDHEKYHFMCQNDMLRIYTVRDDEKLIGYSSWFVMGHMHYRTCMTAISDALYIDPAYRGSTVAYTMFDLALADLRENMNVKIASFHMKVDFPFRKLLKKFGGVLTEENWEIKL